MGIDQVLLPNTLWKQVRDEAQAQSKSLASSSAVAVSMVVATFLLGNPLSSSSASAVRWRVVSVGGVVGWVVVSMGGGVGGSLLVTLSDRLSQSVR